ncbi:hypothetical protein F6R98_12555 [Candidatus Methylospira mobilis]|uniref:Uncharacterized protein n=1 Tax=Candidatus Methylospira mobilis TaxID=1808979 RepID=A0A5Q0BJN6_9GAMM|nr:hypothetical protein [Candidatus Methylospira mobilis]QFY43342.1 hypothetical protein F6R98_12555 [Candidatus Methylospira mobilis]WNV03442.1 hypothetical protein RP726_13375 [Candidatus Methylospira mobilis]
MPQDKTLPPQSSDFIEIQNLFHTLEQPYDLKEITRFNQTYERSYWKLRKEEKQRAEALVDKLIAGLKTPNLASRIFGVV